MEAGKGGCYLQAWQRRLLDGQGVLLHTLLNYLDNMVEKVVADLISEHCEATRGFHPG